MGSFVFSDAIAAVSTKSNVAIENHDTPVKEKEKSEEKAAALVKQASATKSCSKENLLAAAKEKQKLLQASNFI